ncbi:MAG TPA: ABC transporter substrate-binding protein [Microbacteriaceae bacterium]|nr:ABC transporter substrate-binding protein [Microbacteriaceae bacterium]
MKSMQRGILALAAAGALVLTGCSGQGSGSDSASENESSNVLTIGYAAALTGDGAAGDVPGLAGLQYGVDKINESGGVNGITLKVIAKDTQSDSALGGTVAQELVDQGADVLVGPPFPGMASGVLQIAADNGIPVIAGTSTQPEYTLMSSADVFLAAFGDNVQNAAVAQHLLSVGHQKAFVVSSPDMTYTSNGANFFADAFENGGGEVIGEATYSIGQTDFSPLVTSIAAEKENIEVIYTPMFPPDLPSFVRALRGAGVDAPVAGPDGFHTAEVLAAGQEALEGTYFSTHGFEIEGTPLAEFVELASASHPDVKDGPALAALGYTVVEILAEALATSSSTDSAALTEAIQNIEGLETLTGEITYKGTGGVPRKTVTIGGVENGEFVFVDAFVPEYIPTP